MWLDSRFKVAEQNKVLLTGALRSLFHCAVLHSTLKTRPKLVFHVLIQLPNESQRMRQDAEKICPLQFNHNPQRTPGWLHFIPTNNLSVNSCYTSAALLIGVSRPCSRFHLYICEQPFPFVSMCNARTATLSCPGTQDYPSPPLAASSAVTVVANGERHLAHLKPLPGSYLSCSQSKTAAETRGIT